ncbi:MAG: elongation factor Ts [Actinobacteria bacterium]|nr:elongation factor Ts [Actinomycetota bacterium]
MANITAADVKKLRDLTGAGMMECKKALEESDGDIDKAIEALRISGAAKAAKRGAERTASNGLVAAQDNVLVELLCETDFVAKSADFQALAHAVVEAAAAQQVGDVEGLLAAQMSDGRSVCQAIADLAGIIGEKLELGRVAVLKAPVATYMHRRSSDLPPQVGVLVAYEGSQEAARGAAMQVAAMRPSFVSRDDVPADVVANERRIAEATAKEEGKPEAALPKIVEGRLQGFYKDSCLLEQPSVQDSKQSVAQVLQAAGTTVTAFARFEVGQG